MLQIVVRAKHELTETEIEAKIYKHGSKTNFKHFSKTYEVEIRLKQ